MHEPRWSFVAALPTAPTAGLPTALPAVLPAALPATLPAAPASFSDRGRHAAPHQDEPIYTQLVGEWQRRGLMLPGQRDREWVELVTRNGS
jgi:hypothetical protein